jgi:hypothetical protein
MKMKAKGMMKTNPTTTSKTTTNSGREGKAMLRERYFVRVVPAHSQKLVNGVQTKEAARLLFHRCRGTGVLLETRPGTPKVVSDLGGLSGLVLDLASVRNRTVKVLASEGALKQDEVGDTVWSFDWRAVKLVGDGNGDLHIAGFYRPLPETLERGRSYFLGAVVRLSARNARGADVPHPFAPHGGEYPKLYYRDGFLFFRGGTYSITGHGLEG